MTAISEDPITLWLKLGALEKLEQVVLDGYGDQLYGKTSRIPQVNKFLRQVPLFQNKIDEIHKAVSMGSLREVQHLIDRKKLAFCRDHMGASPMHKAVLFGQKTIISYLLDRYSSVVHARDHRGRTPLHYAAVLPDGGEIYRILLNHGADAKATDVYGNIPEYYLQTQDEMNLQVLRNGSMNQYSKPTKPKNFHINAHLREKCISAKPVGSKVQIRELINHGSLEALEDLVIQGHGNKLLGEFSSNPLIKDFLQMVPTYMERIYEIHRSVIRGRLRDVQALLDRKKLALARDALGATPLHKAAMYNNFDLVQYIAYNFPLTKDAKDLDGRTALHYAAVLKDNQRMYNLLISLGANPLVLDYRGKSPEYYLQFPEHLHLEQIIKNSQKANANYVANHTNKIKSTSPQKKSPYPTRVALALKQEFDEQRSDGVNCSNMIDLSLTFRKPDNWIFPCECAVYEQNGKRKTDVKIPENEMPGNGPLSFKMPKRTFFRSQPLLPPPQLKRLEVNSANIKRWVKDEDLDKLEGAVLEGYADKVAREKSDSEGVQRYIRTQVPRLVQRIEAIHFAISNDDLLELQNKLDRKDFALAKDQLGMAPIHRAVLMNKTESLKFLIEKFPETVNAKDKEGRTALHYAAAMSRGVGSISHRLLLEAGADQRIRDNQGRSAEYYRTHQVPIPIKFSLNNTEEAKKGRAKLDLLNPLHKSSRKSVGTLPQIMMERISQSLKIGDVEYLREIVQDGYGHHLIGRTSWNDDVRQFLKTLPSYLRTLENVFEAASGGDIEQLNKFLEQDEKLLKAKNEEGLTVVHQAVLHDQLDVLNYLLERHPLVLNMKDRIGRTPLHIAGQEKNHYMYTILSSAGVDPMTLDQKGRTADFYMNASSQAAKTHFASPKTRKEEPDPEKSKSPSKQQEKEEIKLKERVTVRLEEDKKKENEEEMQKENLGEKQRVEDKEELELEGKNVTINEENFSDMSFVEETEENKQNQPENNSDEENKDGGGEPIGTKFEEHSESGEVKSASIGHNNTADRLNELIAFWIREKDLLRLEHVVIAGQGERLVGRTSEDRQVQEFLDLVPTYMARIRGVHDAVVRGNLGEVEAVLTRKRFALSRDHLGASPLHLAVLHGHTDVVKYIVTNFPEALDGPDNEGKTPLHYAAVVKDDGVLYRMLKFAGSDETIVDKMSRTAEYYVNHPGELTIRDLLQSYKIEDSENKPQQINIWQRPPTDEIEKKLTPPSSGSVEDAINQTDMSPDNKSGEIENDGRQFGESQTLVCESTLYPILFDRKSQDSQYLASVLGDALVKGLTQVAQKKPSDPVGYLATWLYQYASRNSRGKLSAHNEQIWTERGEISEIPNNDTASLVSDDLSRAANIDSNNWKNGKSPPDIPEKDAEEKSHYKEVILEFNDHTKMKDEDGQTVLHFAASRIHPSGSFYGLIGHAEVLLAERDKTYRTARDTAENCGLQENVGVVDKYVLDALLQQRFPIIQLLAHEGYDQILNVRDYRGNDVLSILQQHKMNGSITVLRDIAAFIKLREELHTFIRHSFLDGVCGVVQSDRKLVTAKNCKARCALHLAVVFEHLDIIEALVKSNSSAVHVSDNLGRTPLHYAMASKRVDQIAKILIKSGAMKSVRDVRMRTPSYFFIYKEEIIKIHEEESKLA